MCVYFSYFEEVWKILLSVLRNRVVQFSIVFFLTFMLFAFILHQNFVSNFLNGFVSNCTALHVAFLLKIFGINAYSQGVIVCGETFSLTIVKECTSYYKMMLLVSAIIAYPSPVKHKITGCIAGTVIIYLLNLFRVASLFITGVYFRNSFDMAHEHVTQTIFTFLVAILWLLWISRANKTLSKQ